MKGIIHRFDISIVAFLIVLATLSLFIELPWILEFFSKLFVLLAFMYASYKLSFMRLIFGKRQDEHVFRGSKLRNSDLDLLILCSMASLSVPSILMMVAEEFRSLEVLMKLLTPPLFLVGICGLAAISIFLGADIRFERPSFMSIIHEDVFPSTKKQMLLRILAVLVVMLFYYVSVFRILLQVFVLVLDVPFLVFGLLSTSYFFLKGHHRSFHPSTLVYRAGESIEDFYARIIETVHQKSRVAFFLPLMLMLQALSDSLVFAFPLLLGKKLAFGMGHPSLPALMRGAFGASGSFYHPLVILIASLVALSLLGLPMFLWANVFLHRKARIDTVFLSAFISLLPLFFFHARLEVADVGLENAAGVMFRLSFRNLDTHAYLFLVPVLFLLVLGLAANRNVRMILEYLAMVPVLFFFSEYVFISLASIYAYFRASSSYLLAHGSALFLPLFIFEGLTLLFFSAAYILYLVQLLRLDLDA